ncbi:hypothetical protein [Kitasatospora purpeofusca]|uniref:hypothetical protein n=1 Tax=Kitasatospora purpeofusca TaxID=67352 RepID=UPI002A5AEF6F|nr:hypothetical protein [Kitasatospora purpeofusca]MDY0810865.1 hypothetical protein [Kitasatospora purpeofusca]
MLLLGLLLLAATGAFTGLLIADNLSGGPDYGVTVLGNQIATMNSLAVFLSGIALTLIFGLGLAMATGGAARMRRRADERRETRALARRQSMAEREAVTEREAVADRPAMTDRQAMAEREAPVDREAPADRTTEPAVVPAAEGTSTRSRPHRGLHLFGH